MTFTDKLPRPTDDEMREIVELARDMHTPAAGTVEYALARGLLHKVEPATVDAVLLSKERALIMAMFKTPEGEVSARIQRDPDGVSTAASFAGDPALADWILLRDADGASLEWYHGGLVVDPKTVPLTDNQKNALRVATRSMLVWVTP